MLTAYGDDSSDSKRVTVFAAATVVGTYGQWEAFKRKWESCSCGIPFHATDCESGWDDYKGIGRETRNRIYRDLTTLLAESDLFGFGSAIDIQTFQQMYPEETTREMPYYGCVSVVIGNCAALGAITIPPQAVDITFDRNYERDPSTDAIYNYFGALKEWQYHEHLGERINFADYRQEIGIQVADLLARETMKHMENTMLPPRKRWSRTSFMKLRENPRLHFYFIDREEMTALAFQASKLGPDFAEAYRAWRSENGIQTDNMVNRARFMRLRSSKKITPAPNDRISDEIEVLEDPGAHE